jgi:uncharacterized membrane protein YqhA
MIIEIVSTHFSLLGPTHLPDHHPNHPHPQGIVTLIFGIGVYELFINQIDMGEEKDGSRTERPQWLHIRGIEDLEMRLGKVVITILVVNLMAAAKKVLPTHPSHLVYIGGALFLAACALTVLHWVDGQHS